MSCHVAKCFVYVSRDISLVQEGTLAGIVNFVTLAVPASLEEGVEDADASLYFVVIRDVILCVFELISFVMFSVLEPMI